MSMKLYVGGLPFGTTAEELKTLFSQAGTVQSATIIVDRYTNQSKGFGFVEMASTAEGQAAIQKFNGYTLGGRAIKVDEARPVVRRGGGGGGRRGGGR
ncbi:MAG: RNA-binding protein [Deinococcus sp.]|nr:RNA-binding protein [Deinococcus sp.]